MSGWADRSFLAVDCETTGVDVTSDRIVQVATAVVAPDWETEAEWVTVVDPGVPVPDEAAAVHGITTARCRAEGVAPATAVRRVARYLRTHSQLPLVVFNARFDLPLLLREAARHGVEWPGVPLVLDPLVIDKALDRYRRGSRRLGDMAEHYGVPVDTDAAHDALVDAIVSARLMHQMAGQWPELRAMTLTELFVWQAAQAERQRASFVDYRRTTSDPGFDSPAGWPLPAGAAA